MERGGAGAVDDRVLAGRAAWCGSLRGLDEMFRLHPGLRRILHRGDVRPALDRRGGRADRRRARSPTCVSWTSSAGNAACSCTACWRGKLTKRGGQLLAISTAGERGGEFETLRDAIRDQADDYAAARRDTRAAGRRHPPARMGARTGRRTRRPRRGGCAATRFSGTTLDVLLRRKRESPAMTPGYWSAVRGVPAGADEFGGDPRSGVEGSPRRLDEIPPGDAVHAGLDVGVEARRDRAHPAMLARPGVPPIGRCNDPDTAPRRHVARPEPAVERRSSSCTSRNPIGRLVMDTTRAETIASWARDELGCDVVDRRQTNQLAVEDYNAFTQALRDGVLEHTGDPAPHQARPERGRAASCRSATARFDRPDPVAEWTAKPGPLRGDRRAHRRGDGPAPVAERQRRRRWRLLLRVGVVARRQPKSELATCVPLNGSGPRTNFATRCKVSRGQARGRGGAARRSNRRRRLVPGRCGRSCPGVGLVSSLRVRGSGSWRV